MIPLGLCQCGCGRSTSINKTNDVQRGFVKGVPKKFIRGHQGAKGRTGYLSVVVDGRTVEAHRLIAERAFGRRLPRTVQVHHVDENHQNNANANLVICQDRAYHALLHMRTNVIRAGGNPNTDLFCQACKTAKPVAAFYGRRQKLNGKASRCRECVCSAARDRYENKRRGAGDHISRDQRGVVHAHEDRVGTEPSTAPQDGGR